MYQRLKTSLINCFLFSNCYEFHHLGIELAFCIFSGSVRSSSESSGGALSSILANRNHSQKLLFQSLFLIFIEFFFLAIQSHASLSWSLFRKSLAIDLHISTNFIRLCSACLMSVMSKERYSDSKMSGELMENSYQNASTNSLSWHICNYLSQIKDSYCNGSLFS